MLDDAGVSYQIVLTKVDKTGPGELAPVLEGLTAELARHAAAHPEIHFTSAVKRNGIAELRASIADFAVPAEQ
jgi:GTP-binding protein